MTDTPDKPEGASPISGVAPPVASRWKKGQSGNPGGRPKGTSITSLLRQILSEEHNGKALKELLAERIIKEALAGKYPFAKEVLDRLDGLAGKPQHTNEPVRIIVQDYRGRQREGTAQDIRNVMAPPVEREIGSLREFYSKYSASPPETPNGT